MPEWRPGVEREARARLGRTEADAFLTRLELLSADITEPLAQVYGPVTDPGQLATDLVLDALEAAATRPAPLRMLDRRREIDPAWFQRSEMIGYVCYADRFAGSLAGVREHLDYLAELGVTYLHLMPLLRPRDGETDGGYAVADYDAVDPELGTMDDLQAPGRRPARARHGAVRRPRAQPHRGASTNGPARHWPASPATARCT